MGEWDGVRFTRSDAMWEGEEVLRSVWECIEDNLPLDAPKKAVIVQIYDADPGDVERLIRRGDYGLACACGTERGTVRLVAVKEVGVGGFTVSNTVFSRLVPERTYGALRASVRGSAVNPGGRGVNVMAKDPVCGVEVDEKKAAATVRHMGKTFYFCSSGCKETFEKDHRSI